MYDVYEPKETDKQLVKFYTAHEGKDCLILRFQSLWGWYQGQLNCFVKDDPDPRDCPNGFWFELCGNNNPSPEEIHEILADPILATVEKLDQGEGRPLLICITKLHPIK
jgi:hypothetical protein